MTPTWELPHRPRRHRLWLGVGIAAAVIVLAGTAAYVIHGLWPTSFIPSARTQKLATIEAMPEAKLLAPDSHVLLQRGYNRTSLGIGVASYESFDTVAGVNASKQVVFDYYKQQLAKRGWQGPGSEDLNATNRWTRGAYEFSIAFLGRPGDPTYAGESNYSTTYSFGIQYAPNLASATPTP
jgi:hypothetical protein